MSNIRILSMLLVGASSLAMSAPANAQRQSAQQSAPDRNLPLCRVADPGETCRTRSGEIRVRRGRPAPTEREAPTTNNLGGGDPGWEVREQHGTQFGGDDVGFATAPADGVDPTTHNLGGGDPGWEVRERPGTQFGGGDVGFATGGTASAPEAMECENCDDDEDEPQGPIDNTPRPQEPTSEAPDDDEDCEWRNPSSGPDQEFCDE
ncbi:MAG: hypothetical protein DHS20C06_00350 [Hyphobacterium sp.]|nr:MAG: hypothetical protein DHS20C06_00350 [Hyphobacterium sp.]